MATARRSTAPRAQKVKPAAVPFPSTPIPAPKSAPRYTLDQIERTLVNKLRNEATDQGTQILTFAEDNIQGHGISLTLPNRQRVLMTLLEEA